GALEELRAVGALAPGDTAVQRKLATLLFEQGDWVGAEQSLEKLVKSRSLPQAEHVDVLIQLSELRVAQGDRRGAENALRDAMKLDPDLMHEPFQRLEAFHAAAGGDAGLAATLTELTKDPKSDPRWMVRLGQLEVHRLGRPNEGLQHLRLAVASLPHDAAAQLAFAEGLLAIGAHDEASKSLRELVLRDPSNPAALEAEHAALLGLGRKDEALVINELRAYCGFAPDRETSAAFRARRLPRTPPREETLDDVSIYSHVMPAAAKIPIFEVLTALADQLPKIVVPDIGAIGLSTRDRHTNRSTHPWRTLVDRAAHALGVGEVDLYVHDSPDQRMLVENFETPAIVVPSSLKALPELEIAFAIGRLVAKVATRTYLLDKLRPAELEEILLGAVGPYGGPIPRARAYEIEEIGKRIQKAVARKTRRQLEEIAPRVTAFDPARFARAVDQGALRTSYLLTGDLTSALDHLRRYEEVAVSELGRAETTTGDLIRFALTADASTLRRRLGTSWA
ncbi:MAG: tetratricopeptide repeat protein, partial [Polyangiales bacterium]